MAPRAGRSDCWGNPNLEGVHTINVLILFVDLHEEKLSVVRDPFTVESLRSAEQQFVIQPCADRAEETFAGLARSYQERFVGIGSAITLAI